MINIVTALQDDQMSNMFQVLFPEGVPGGGEGLTLALRMDQQFDIPNRTLTQYNVEYQGIVIPKTAAKEETTKNFTLSFRLDQNWLVHKFLNDWFELNFNERESTYKSEADTRVPMLFQALGPDRAVKKQIKYENCKLFDLKPTTMDHTSGDPVRIEGQFLYSNQLVEI